MKSNSPLLAVPVTSLGLSSETVSYLRQIGIRTVRDLSSRLRIAGFAARHPTAADESARAVRCLLAVATVDWDKYHVVHPTLLSRPVLPFHTRVHWSASSFLAELPAALTQLTKLQFTPKHQSVLQGRLLARPGERMTQADLGLKLGVSRNRVHTMEKRMLDLIGRALVKADYRRCRFVFHPAFAEPLRNLARAVETANGRIELTPEAWRERLRVIWGLKPEQVRERADLIRQLLIGHPAKELATFTNRSGRRPGKAKSL